MNGEPETSETSALSDKTNHQSGWIVSSDHVSFEVETDDENTHPLMWGWMNLHASNRQFQRSRVRIQHL